MLSLKEITKNYKMGDTAVEALKGVSVDFRGSEFVAVLGPSGCGKTTMLNIIGGLDRYTSGDLVIDGVSTKKYRDRDWDTYRNHKIGFVFQSYNLIPHQTVLSNVELALTLSGVSKSERRKRAVEVLEKVGLRDQMKKKPNQMSGGQMQRVAIARALINDPDILLADEPTGALDSETSVQIMEILREISKDKLIIMVTHNPELAEQYANRIIKLMDGKITGDSNPFTAQAAGDKSPEKVRRTSMSYPTALSLSLNNLMTKKGRTILTAFAGSIGIIGIALILSLSNGVQNYIDDIQHDTLASYPLVIDESSTDFSSFMSTASSERAERENERETRPLDRIYTTDRLGDMFESMYAETNTNDLKSFKEFLDTNEEVKKLVSNIEYSYGLTLDVFSKLDSGEIKQVNPSTVLDDIGFGAMSGMMSLRSQISSSAAGADIFTEITDDEGMFNTKYEIVAGKRAEKYDEAVLIVDKYNQITDFTLYDLGMRPSDELRNTVKDMIQKKDKEEIEKLSESSDYSYDDFIGKTFSVIPQSSLYEKTEEGRWELRTGDADFMEKAYAEGTALTIVGIIREKETSSVISGAIGYTRALTEYISGKINESEIVKEQAEKPDYDVFTGLPFEGTEAGDKAVEEAKEKAEKEKQELEELKQKMQEAAVTAAQQMMPDMTAMMQNMTPEQQAALMQMSPEEQQRFMEEQLSAMAPGAALPGAADGTQSSAALPEGSGIEAFMQNFDPATFDAGNITPEQMSYFMSLSDEERESLTKMMSASVPAAADVVSRSSQFDNNIALGVIDLSVPSSISIYPNDFEAKEKITQIIKDYNNSVEESKRIVYTDIVGMLMSSVTDIVNAISYILIAFVAISLVVSSIMIGIITYISVLERTKEIGILRSIGASKKDISRVFNAETMIIGFVSGSLGIVVTLLLNIPINIIIEGITEVSGLAALPPFAAVILIAISVLLTLIAGLFPSGVAAKKDPVIALRSE